ncbi:hypothetical protein D9756_007711 [Leucocoprinus leucothites]|uniref:rRNA adenine N(6)-methyltransferase n=1 Tax=Leucocoprinus leucothites TaxID=201217 RepID=A0A8H5D3S3_9AGAR|nr:hypothetical protein D9756_007711 [Leucoagaricus leucothites]
MAFRAASFARHARSLTIRLSRVQRPPLTSSSSIRSFSSTPTNSSSSQPFPIDSLVADVIKTNNELEANPARKRAGRPKQYVESETIAPQADLPPAEEWLNYFPWTMENKGRASVMNPETAQELAEAYVPEGSKDRIIIEAFPGPGALTRALLKLPKERIKKLIVLEENPLFNQWLKPLEDIDPRITVVPVSGYQWNAYDYISNHGYLEDVQTIDWSQEHTQLSFISHVPDTVHGEQLISQFLRCIPDHGWLFKYGRVPLHLTMTEALWQRISDPPGSITRCKLGVIAEATALYDYALPPALLAPYKLNFFPPNIKKAPDFVGITVKPLKEPVIESGLLDDWDYVLRRMFVQKATPVHRSIPTLAPGAASLLKKITAESTPPDQRLNVKLTARKLTAKEWRIIVRAFANWPFKPEDLSIDNYHSKTSRQVTIM